MNIPASSSDKITARLGGSGNTFVINPGRNVFFMNDIPLLVPVFILFFLVLLYD